MATPERHESTLDVAADVLYIMSKYPDLISKEMREKFDEWGITDSDIANSLNTVNDIRDLINRQMF